MPSGTHDRYGNDCSENTTKGMAMQMYSLPRSGKSELVITGEQLAKVDERELYGFKESWTDVSLYKTSFDHYVLSTSCTITNCGHTALHSAVVFSSPQSLMDYLKVGCSEPASCLGVELLRQASLADGAFSCCGPGCPVQFRSSAACTQDF